MSPAGRPPGPEVTRKASTVVADLERWLAGGDPSAITRAHGWPDPVAVKDNITWLRRLGDATVTFDIPDTTSRKDADVMPTPTPPPARANGGLIAPQDTIANLLAAAHQHDKPAIKKQAEKIDALLARLRDDIKADREDAIRRKEIAALEERLRELKGTKPKKPKPPSRNLDLQTLTCDECGQECKGKRGLSAYTKIVHEGFRPNAAKAAS